MSSLAHALFGLGSGGSRMGVVGDVDVFRRDPGTGEQALVSTTRPCFFCGEPLEGLVLTDRGGHRIHAKCRRNP